MKAIVIAAVAALGLTASSTALAAGNGCSSKTTGNLRQCIIGSALTAGDYATTVVSGTVNRPSNVVVVIYTSQSQPVDVSWTMVCTRGMGAGSKSGQFRLLTVKDNTGGPTHHAGAWTMKQVRSFPMANADSCDVSADAQLSASGSLRLELLGLSR